MAKTIVEYTIKEFKELLQEALAPKMVEIEFVTETVYYGPQDDSSLELIKVRIIYNMLGK